MKFARKAPVFAALATTSVLLLAACGGGSSGGSSGNSSSSPSAGAAITSGFGSIPAATGSPKAGQTINIAQAPSATPTWIFPITPAANGSVYTAYDFQYLMWRPLYFSPVGTEQKLDPTLSLGNTPTWSNGNKTVTFTMKTNYKWSNGSTVSAKDVLFFYYLLKAAIKENPSNFGNYSAGSGIPDQVTSISAPNATTVKMTLNKAVNPTWFTDSELTLLSPLPTYAWSKTSANGPVVDASNPANAKKIYDFLAAQSKQVTKYATDPLWQAIDGPFKLTSFNNTSGAYSMAPNPTYGGPHANPQSAFNAVPFTSDEAEWNAVKAGKVDVGYMPQVDVPQKDSITGTYNYFGEPGFGWSYITYNFANTTGDWNNIIKQLYFRQAFAHLQDQKGVISAFFHGAGSEAYGPIPTEPKSPYAPANASTNPYPYSVDTATSILKSHGWTINPGGTDVCQNAGSGANQCGPGIPAGTKLSFNLIYNTSPAVIGQQVTTLASQAKKAGINIKLQTSNFNFMISNYNNPAPTGKKNINKWAMEDFGGFSEGIYPTTNEVFNTKGSFNIGSYSDPKADQLIEASTFGSSTSAVTEEASYLTQQMPGLFQPNPDVIAVWKKTMSGNPNAYASLTQYQFQLEYMYFKK
jgi:peptide/nickel transport system substrate-binding protein